MKYFSPFKILQLSSLDLKTHPSNFFFKMVAFPPPYFRPYDIFSLNLQFLYDKWNYDILNTDPVIRKSIFPRDMEVLFKSACFIFPPYSL